MFDKLSTYLSWTILKPQTDTPGVHNIVAVIIGLFSFTIYSLNTHSTLQQSGPVI